MKQNRLITGILCALGCEVFYGMSFVFTKQATADASILSLLGWRFALAFVVMSIFVALRIVKVDYKKKNKKPLLVAALFCPVIYFIGETIGIRNTTASESGVIIACIPIASMIASTVFLRKKPAGLQVLGILITLAGVLVTVLAAGVSSSLSLPGYAALFVAVIAYALYCVSADKASHFSGGEITYVMLIAGAIVFTALAFGEAGIQGNVRELLALPFTNRIFGITILYEGIGCSICAFFLSNTAIAQIGVNRTASFIGLGTVISILSGRIWLGERFTMYQIIGAIVILAGVYIANATKKDRPQ